MHNGIIQQQGTAEQLYKNPVNKFVAGFLGSPPMNFFDGLISDTDGHLEVSGDGYNMPLPEGVRFRLKDLGSKDVIVGIRPTAFTHATGNEEVQLKLPIILSEYIGSQSVIVSNLGKQQILIEVGSDTPLTRDEVINIAVDPESLYLFDPDTEAAL